MLDKVKLLVDIFFPLATVGLAFFGLGTWKAQLKGGSKYTLAVEALREHYSLKEEVRRYRSSAFQQQKDDESYAKTLGKTVNGNDQIAEYKDMIERQNWNSLIQQYQKYRASLVQLKIAINDYKIDFPEGKNRSITDTVIENLAGARMEREFLDQNESSFGQLDEVQMKSILDRRLRNFQILTVGPESNDEIVKELERSFELINGRLRRFL